MIGPAVAPIRPPGPNPGRIRRPGPAASPFGGDPPSGRLNLVAT